MPLVGDRVVEIIADEHLRGVEQRYGARLNVASDWLTKYLYG